jgi:hypothetical protein
MTLNSDSGSATHDVVLLRPIARSFFTKRKSGFGKTLTGLSFREGLFLFFNIRELFFDKQSVFFVKPCFLRHAVAG